MKNTSTGSAGAKKIIAVVGMAGSGKSEAVKYLQKKYGWPKVYFGSATFDRLKKEGLETNYENERIIREKIRQELGPGAYAILASPKINKALKESNVVIVESLYSWDEYKILKKKFKNNFKTIAVFASPEIRFKRLKARKKERPMKDRKEFEKRDFTEIENIAKGGPIARADFMIINESDLKNLEKQVDYIIKKLIKTKQ